MIDDTEIEFCQRSINRLKSYGWKDFEVQFSRAPQSNDYLSDYENFNELMRYIVNRPRGPWFECTDPYGVKRNIPITVSIYATLIGIEFEQAWQLKKISDHLGLFEFQRTYLTQMQSQFNVPASVLGYS